MRDQKPTEMPPKSYVLYRNGLYCSKKMNCWWPKFWEEWRSSWRQGRRYLVESGGINIFSKLTLGYFWSPNTQCMLNWATFGAQAWIFGTERPHFWTFLLLYDSKDEMKSMLKWTTGPKRGLRSASSKIIV